MSFPKLKDGEDLYKSTCPLPEYGQAFCTTKSKQVWLQNFIFPSCFYGFSGDRACPMEIWNNLIKTGKIIKAREEKDMAKEFTNEAKTSFEAYFCAATETPFKPEESLKRFELPENLGPEKVPLKPDEKHVNPETVGGNCDKKNVVPKKDEKAQLPQLRWLIVI